MAMTITPKSKAGQLADLLRVRLLGGEWSRVLSAERVLAEEYLVSRTTLRAALHLLENEGWIGAASSTRSGHAVRRRTPGGRRIAGAGRVVFLTPSLKDDPVLLQQLGVLRELLGRSGVQVSVRDAAGFTAHRQPQRELQRIAADHPGAVWVLHQMPRLVQLAAQELHLPALICGSAFAGIELPSIDVDFRAVARHAAGRCLSHGLTRFALLVHRTPLAGNEAIIETVTAELHHHGVPPPLILRHDFHRDRLIGALDRHIVSAATRPDVLLVVNQLHLLTALSHLLHRQLRIPRDLSLVYLSNDPSVERLSPLPDRYDLGDRLMRRLAVALKARLAGDIQHSQRLLPKHLKGETLA